METTPPRLFDLRPSTFKSYYVVWKLFFFIIRLKKQIKFKSYYVVWKLTHRFIFFVFFFMFKSYYVVWKLRNILLALRMKNTFKSYYVVWKLRRRSRSSIVRIRGLNRTMQYGNEAGVGVIHIQEKSLNRTMQYGNLCSPPDNNNTNKV